MDGFIGFKLQHIKTPGEVRGFNTRIALQITFGDNLTD